MQVAESSSDQPARLLGRDTELAEAEAALIAAADGDARAVAIVGEAGIGKTRLMAELGRRAAAAGYTVVEGRATELENTIPFGLVVEALNDHVLALGNRAIRGLRPDTIADLALVLPAISKISAARPSQRLAAERYEYHRAVRSLLEHLTRSAPVLLSLDDVHWADSASVELIAYLLRKPANNVLLALAFRPRPLIPALRNALEQADRAGLLTRQELAPLTPAQTATLLAQPVDAAIVAEFHRATGGNPFYVEQLAKTVFSSDQRSGNISGSVIDTIDIPSRLRDTVVLDLSRLSRPVSNLAQIASIVGDPFEIDIVSDIAGDELEDIEHHLDALIAADLIQPIVGSKSFRFRHPIVRRVVYDNTPAASRLIIHRKIAALLCRRGASPSARAHHLQRSARQGDETAIATLVEAGRSTADRAPATAAGWFEAATALLPDEIASDKRRELLIAQASCLASCGQLRDSRAALEQALQLAADSPGERARIVAMVAHADHGLGRADQAHRLITSTLEAGSAGRPSAIPLQLILAENLLMRGKWGDAVHAARHAHAHAYRLSNHEMHVMADAWLAWATSYVCDAEETSRLIDRSAYELDKRDADLSPILIDSLVKLVYAEFVTDRFRAAGSHIERGLQVARTTGHNHFFSRFLLIDAAVKLLQGRLIDALTSSEAAVEAAYVLDNDQALATAEAIRCWTTTLVGDITTALVAGRAAVRAAQRRPDALFAWLAYTTYGQALIEAGHIEAGKRAILSAGGPELSDLPPSVRPFWHQPLLAAELKVGCLGEAKAIAERIEASATGLQSREGHMYQARSCISFAAGDFFSSANSAHNAADCFDEVGMPIWSARAHLMAGRARHAAGETAAAIKELELAYVTFCDTGAGRLRDEAAKELRGIGRRVRPQAATGPYISELTEREREIAERVAQGLSNRNIAADLYISPKTVEKHLARVFAKLAVTSRAGVAAALHRASENL
ncbi:helix-turn-helix transcriptional regulator [Nocardia sp. CY41]|uniref:helix-turn-helix transcriptional regulator n=1 Tax=Nocardia sp. CY41 TaxID=2608686 RepID=UPI00135B91E1|nr:AAA family ATPase [Nocardia sp. CY41]